MEEIKGFAKKVGEEQETAAEAEKEQEIQQEAAEEKAEKKGKKKAKKIGVDNPDEVVREMGGGTLKLGVPILADDEEITELKFNFNKLTGMEMMDAMDRGGGDRSNAFRITNKQALELFIATAGKETEGLDAGDVRRGLSPMDAVKAVQLATVFFVASSQAGNARITR